MNRTRAGGRALYRMVLTGLVLLVAMGLVACGGDDESGEETGGTGDGDTSTMSLYLTDAPINASNVTGVFITLTRIDAIRAGDDEDVKDNWITLVEEADLSQTTFNLMDLQNGASAPLFTEVQMEPGTYSQLRFILQAPEEPEEGQPGPPSNPGSAIEFDDDDDGIADREEPLFTPSGAQSGYKATVGDGGSFEVPENGEVTLTADFDAQKSIVQTGSVRAENLRYLLKPTLRLVVNDQAGSIGGTVTDSSGGGSYSLVVYAYEQGTYADSEADDPTGQASRFPNAVTSAVVQDDDSYTLAFLAAGDYELVVASYADADGAFNTPFSVVDFTAQEGDTDAARRPVSGTTVSYDILENATVAADSQTAIDLKVVNPAGQN